MQILHSTSWLGFCAMVQYNKVYTNYKDQTIPFNTTVMDGCNLLATTNYGTIFFFFFLNILAYSLCQWKKIS